MHKGVGRLPLVIAVGIVAGVAPLPLAAQTEGNGICTMSKADQQKASDAFAALLPVLRDRRCSNCHGAVDPFSPTGGHGGGVIDLREALSDYTDRDRLAAALAQTLDISVATPEFLDRTVAAIKKIVGGEVVSSHDEVIKRLSSANGLAVVEPCRECHQEAKAKWQLAVNAFPPKSDVQLCMHFRSTMTGEKFAQHISDDDLGFIPLAFAGSRGLNGRGMAEYEDRTHRRFVNEPPAAMSFDAFEVKAHEWVAVLGPHFQGKTDCGCKPHSYRLSVDIYADVAVTAPAAATTGATHTSFLVDLVFGNGLLAGEAVVPRSVQMQTDAGKVHCTTAQSWTETWDVNGAYADGAPALTLKMRRTQGQPSGQLRCQMDGKPFNMPMTAKLPGGAVWTPEFRLPAVVGEKRTFIYPFGGRAGQSTIELAVVEAE